jgi:hypothetical protein
MPFTVHSTCEAPAATPAELEHGREEGRVLVRQAVPHRVREVDDRRARLDRAAADSGDEAGVGAGRVLARELDLVGFTGGVADGGGRELEDLGGRQPKLPFHVQWARRDDEVQARAVGRLQRLGRGVHVGPRRAAERGDGRASHGFADRLDPGEVARRGRSEACLDHVDAEPLELEGDDSLPVGLQRDAGRLLAVPQSRVEDLDRTQVALLSCLGGRPALGTHLGCNSVDVCGVAAA